MAFEWRTPEEQQQIVERLQKYNQPVPESYKG